MAGYTCTGVGGRHVATFPDAAKKRVELFLRSLASFSFGRSVDFAVVKNDVYDVMQPRKERERERKGRQWKSASEQERRREGMSLESR